MGRTRHIGRAQPITDTTGRVSIGNLVTLVPTANSSALSVPFAAILLDCELLDAPRASAILTIHTIHDAHDS